MVFDPHPYNVLAIDPLASNSEILKAFAKSMQRREYSPAVLAQARKLLMDPLNRTVAHYLYGGWRTNSPSNEPNIDGAAILQVKIDHLLEAIADLSTQVEVTNLTEDQIATEKRRMTKIICQGFLDHQ